MTCRALFRCGLVEQHVFAINRPQSGVAFRAAEVRMHTFKFERRPRVVIEQRGSPLVGVVTADATNRLAVLLELPGMGIDVTSLTLFRSRPEIDMQQANLQVRRLMTSGTRDGAMRTEEFETGGCVVKLRQVAPRCEGMASGATHGLAIGPWLRHAIGELTPVRILVAGRTAETLEAIRRDLQQLRIAALGVTLTASHGNVRSFERESRLPMELERVERRMESLHRMTRLAAIQQRGILELAGVSVAMTVSTLCEFDLEEGRASGWEMALRTLDRRMLPFQRIGTLRMLHDAKLRRLPALHGMA